MKTLGFRFILLFSAVTVPLLLILFAAGHYAQSVVLTQVANSYQNLVTSNLHMIDRSLDDITTYMVDIVNHDGNFRKFGQAGLSDEDSFFARSELVQRNLTYRSYYHTVDMFYVYSSANGRLALSNAIGPSESHMDQVKAWIDGSLGNPAAIGSLPYQWSVVRIGDDYYLHRAVGDGLGSSTFIGALIHANTLKKPLGTLDLREGGDVLFAGADGTVLSAPSPSFRLASPLPAGPLAASGSFSFTDGGRKLFAVTSRSQVSGISMAVVLPHAELLRGLNRFQAVIGLLPFFVLGILLVYLLIFRRIVFRPILQLLGAIRRIKEGEMETHLPPSPISEFDTINRAFNSMVEEIHNLKIDVYEERLNAQKAELKRLQTQINPHFFLNTLNIVHQLAELKRNDLVKKTVRHMVQYFRFMLGAGKEEVTLAQEMEHIRNYLEIQKMRYQDAFRFEIRIPEKLRDARIPSLIVQPFVENAMVHGMSMKAEPFTLEIRADRVEMLEGLGEARGGLWIEVKDNGKGMDPGLLKELADGRFAPASEDNHIGIWNVKQRLAMRYGELARLSFRPISPRGLSVCLYIPVEIEKEGSPDGPDVDCG